MEILIGITSIVIAILVWLFPPEPLQKWLGLKKTDPTDKRKTKAPTHIPSFIGAVSDYNFEALSDKKVTQFMKFLWELNVGEIVFLNLEIGADQMESLDRYELEGNTKAYTFSVINPEESRLVKIDMVVEPSDDFFYGPISVTYGQLRGHFRYLGWYGIGTGAQGYKFKAVPWQG